MRVSKRMSFAAIAIALSGAAGPVLAQYRVSGPYYVEPAPAPVYVTPAPGAVYVDPTPTGSIYAAPAPGYVYRPPARTLGDARQRYTGEYQGGGQGDYYLGVAHPPQVP